MCHKIRNRYKNQVQSSLNCEQALGAKDALAREIYSRMFDWIIGKVNIALQRYKVPFRSVIGILDIYGFGFILFVSISL